MADVVIQIGDELLDVDADSKFGLTFKNQWLDFGRDSGMRTYDVSVPATRKNNRLFQYHEMPSTDGQRTRMKAAVTVGGVRLDGHIYVDEWSGNRYSLLFITGVDVNFTTPINSSIYEDSINYDKSFLRTGGTIPNFGLYNYLNSVNPPHSRIYPTANLGYLIDTAANYLGYNVNYLSAERLQDAHAYGLILDRMEVKQSVMVRVQGHALKPNSSTPPWVVTPSSGSLADAGLTVSQKTYKRGDFGIQCQVWVIKALRDVTIRVGSGQGIIIAKGRGTDIVMNVNGLPFQHLGQQGQTFDLPAGDWFSVGSWDEVHGGFFGGIVWNYAESPHGFTTDLDFTFEVERETTTIAEFGDILRLDQNLPDMTLDDYLTNFCLLTCQVWSVDFHSKEINVRPLDGMLTNMWEVSGVERMKIAGVNSVKKYIDGWGINNVITCKSADYVNESCKFFRNFVQNNDFVDDEQVIGQVAWNEGNWVDSSGEPILFAEDITLDEDGNFSGKGNLTIIVENDPGEMARHVEVLNRQAIGEAFRAFVYDASTITLDIYMYAFDFVNLQGTDGRCVTWGGKRWVVREANWSGEVATLTLISV